MAIRRRLCDDLPIHFDKIDPAKDMCEVADLNAVTERIIIDVCDASERWEKRLTEINIKPHQFIVFQLMDLAMRHLILEDGEDRIENFTILAREMFRDALARTRAQRN